MEPSSSAQLRPEQEAVCWTHSPLRSWWHESARQLCISPLFKPISSPRCVFVQALCMVAMGILVAAGWRIGGMAEMGLVSRASPVHTAMRNCTGDEGGPFEFGNQVLISSHRKLLSSKAMVVNVAETSGRDPGRHG